MERPPTPPTELLHDDWERPKFTPLGPDYNPTKGDIGTKLSIHGNPG